MSIADGENMESQQVDQDEDSDSIFELIRRVEGRTFLYDCRDPKHSRRDSLTSAWNEIANGLIINRRAVNGDFCKKKWKALRDYYYKIKKTMKGKSGKPGGAKKPWVYFAAMDRVLSCIFEENENTQSNFDEDDSDKSNEAETPRPDSPTNEETTGATKNSGNESTQQDTSSTRKANRRKLENEEKILNEKILKVLEEPEEIKDEFYHFGMTVCKRLRRMDQQKAEYAMGWVSTFLYDLTYSRPQQTDVYQQPSNDESTPYVHQQPPNGSRPSTSGYTSSSTESTEQDYQLLLNT